VALPDLTQSDDEDWVAFQNADEDWFLKVAGRAVRKYCGWHIYPNLQQVAGKLRVGSKGIVPLPSRLVTAISEVRIHPDTADQAGQFPPPSPGDGCLSPRDYEWHQGGWLQIKGASFYYDWYYAGYWYGNDPWYTPVTMPYIAKVSFWHGYAEVPTDVKEVIFELAQQSMTVTSGNVKSVEAPMFRLSPSQDFGLTLNRDQRNRLANYRVSPVV
jgi:hypothetical protein